MLKVTKNVDALGFDKWQIADVRRAYQSNKAIYTKMNKIAEKIESLSKDYEALKTQTEAWEAPVKIITQKVLGMDLTSQEVLAYHKSPELFVQNYPEHPMIAEINERIAATAAESEPAPAEETFDPEEEVPSGGMADGTPQGASTVSEPAFEPTDIPF